MGRRAQRDKSKGKNLHVQCEGCGSKQRSKGSGEEKEWSKTSKEKKERGAQIRQTASALEKLLQH